MPNWIEGTLKLRGKRVDIIRFFREGLEPPTPIDSENQVTDYSDDDVLEFDFKDWTHIKGTRRAFITDNYAYMDHDEGVICVYVKQAWAFYTGVDSGDQNKWKAISDEYNLDIKLFGIESGMEFIQEMIIIRGRKPIVNEWEYEDWDWECPFPKMGG